MYAVLPSAYNIGIIYSQVNKNGKNYHNKTLPKRKILVDMRHAQFLAPDLFRTLIYSVLRQTNKRMYTQTRIWNSK